ncbi:Kinase suppressor of Ras 2 [Nymphon striatum]|nr:Kinase suppressor of Ras 2 [Nymphon striatum]
MADVEPETSARRALELCAMVQSMIDISAEHLDGLRTQCATSAELTQQEIRSLETKLIKLFCRQLLAKSKVADQDLHSELQQYPSLKQWLQVVGLTNKSIAAVSAKSKTFENLLDSSEQETKVILQKNTAKDEEIRRLLIAVRNLKTYRERLLNGEKTFANELDLHWDSWDRNARSSPRPPRTRAARSSVPSEELLKSTPCATSVQAPLSPPPNSISHTVNMSRSATTSPHHPAMWSPTPISSARHHSHSSSNIPPMENLHTPNVPCERRCTPPPTPPIKKGEKVRFPTTPPPRKKHNIINLTPDPFPLNRSKSHEEHLGHKIEAGDAVQPSENIPRRRLATEPGLENATDVPRPAGGFMSPQKGCTSPLISPDQQYNDDGKSVRSPRMPTVPGSMTHSIRHKLTSTLKVTTCDFCYKAMFRGYKCKCCKYKCHKDCADKVPPSCGLPQEYLNVFSQSMKNDGMINLAKVRSLLNIGINVIKSMSPFSGNHSPILGHHQVSSPSLAVRGENDNREIRWPMMNTHSNVNIPPFPGPDSSSTSSCNSSTPSSPALIVTNYNLTGSLSKNQQFHFPDFSDSDKGVTIETRPIASITASSNNEMIETHKSNDSDKTVSGTSHSGSTDSDKTLAGPMDSQDSQISDADTSERGWPRQNSFSLREWDIPYNELDIGTIVGTGRFGTVYRGNWHGNVAIKFLNMDHLDDNNILDTFKQEVSNFRKTRHDNLVLFMGACMKPPHLAIVTSYCQGRTLYTHLHIRKDKFNLSRTISIAQQISQGMGYLHARQILHRDLKSKNIFFENGKVVITDFGLFSVTRLCLTKRAGDGLSIPTGWLCYLSPEIVCCLSVSSQQANSNLPFSKESDVYAFGTVWYELLCGDWPFKNQPPEAVIWQVGKGCKQSLTDIHASRDVKEILMSCWSYSVKDRKDFSHLASSVYYEIDWKNKAIPMQSHITHQHNY